MATKLALVVVGSVLSAALAPAVAAADLLVQQARVVDGTGAPSVIADVRIRGDRIVAVMNAGEWVVDGGQPTGRRPGKALRKPALVQP